MSNLCQRGYFGSSISDNHIPEIKFAYHLHIALKLRIDCCRLGGHYFTFKHKASFAALPQNQLI